MRYENIKLNKNSTLFYIRVWKNNEPLLLLKSIIILFIINRKIFINIIAYEVTKIQIHIKHLVEIKDY